MSQVVYNGKIFIDGKEIPACPSKRKSTCIVTINNHVYVNGWEYRNNKWRRTLKALFHYIF